MSLPFRLSQFSGNSFGAGNPEATKDRDPGRTLVAHLNDVRGTATVAAASASVAVQLDASLDGQPAVAVANTVDGTFVQVQTAVWNGTGLLTITGAAAATADVTVSYWVAGVSQE